MIKHDSIKKQRELNEYLSSYNMTYKKLLQLIKMGIRQKKDEIPPMRNAFRGGNYLGCPGKDVHFGLLKLNMDQNELFNVCKSFASVFPNVPLRDHTGVAACFRYIYGCFDKQGILLSSQHRKIVANNNWKIALPFIDIVENEFLKSNNYYGLVIHYEMKAHRYGDDAIIYKSKDDISIMLDNYSKSQEFALKSKSYKHTFTPIYWAACYLEQLDTSKAVLYHMNSLEMMDKYCPDARDGYMTKAIHSCKYIIDHIDNDQKHKFTTWIKTISNVCLVRIKQCDGFRFLFYKN